MVSTNVYKNIAVYIIACIIFPLSLSEEFLSSIGILNLIEEMLFNLVPSFRTMVDHSPFPYSLSLFLLMQCMATPLMVYVILVNSSIFFSKEKILKHKRHAFLVSILAILITFMTVFIIWGDIEPSVPYVTRHGAIENVAAYSSKSKLVLSFVGPILFLSLQWSVALFITMNRIVFGK